MAPPVRGPRPRHVPVRTCVACRSTNAKRELVRIVKGSDGSVTIDASGKRNGRGAYLCSNPDCWDAGLKRGVLPRALKIETIPENDLETLNGYAQELKRAAIDRPKADDLQQTCASRSDMPEAN